MKLNQIGSLVLAVVAMACSGCVVAMGNKGNAFRDNPSRQAVVVNGTVYIVNTCDGTVSKVDLQNEAPLTVEKDNDELEIGASVTKTQ